MIQKEALSEVTAPPRQHIRPVQRDVPSLLDSLQDLETYQPSNNHIFPSIPSLRWYIRSHRGELIKSGALIEVAGRLLIDAPKFARKVLAIGAKVAAARGGAAKDDAPRG